MTSADALATSPRLPQNLLETIIDIGHGDDSIFYPSLANCCLLSKALLPAARRAQYQAVGIEWKQDGAGALAANSTLPDTLKTAPHLAELVRELYLIF